MPRRWDLIGLLACTFIACAMAQRNGSKVQINFRVYPPDASVYHVTASSKKFLGKAHGELSIPVAWTTERCLFTFARPGFSFEDGPFGWDREHPPSTENGEVTFPFATNAPIKGTPNNALINLYTSILFNPLPASVSLAVLVFGGGYWLKGRRDRAATEAYARKREALTARFDGTDALLGKTLGRYLVIDRLGEGGMATVYKAVPEGTLDLKETVAIKVMQSKMAEDPEFRERFQREVKLSKALHHPNIIRVDDFGEQEGLMYLVLEFVPGETLDRKIPRQGMSLDEAMAYLEPTIDALIYAHARGVVHRDLKPENIMVTRDGVLKVMDFGLARTQQVSSKLTKTGSAMGTPAYMAPEQITGALPRPTIDQYALGIMAYELLTGRRPFDEGDGDMMALLFKHMSESPPSPRQWKPSIEEPLAKLVLRMLEKDPNRRFASLEDVREGLQAIDAGRPWDFPPMPGPSDHHVFARKPREATVEPQEASGAMAVLQDQAESTCLYETAAADAVEGTVGFEFVPPDGQRSTNLQERSAKAAPDADGTVGFQFPASESIASVETTVGFQALPSNPTPDDGTIGFVFKPSQADLEQKKGP